jgi:hypothetical protein
VRCENKESSNYWFDCDRCGLNRLCHHDNVGYAKLEESVLYVANQSESMAALIAPITNPFGIRDDILDYIIKTIPASNESAMRAAIKMMQYEQQVYYGNPSESEALILDSKDDLAGSCLASYLHQTSGQDKLKDVLDVRDMRMQLFNTKAREKRMWDVANKYFAWHVLGSGLSTSEEIIACEKGEF